MSTVVVPTFPDGTPHIPDGKAALGVDVDLGPYGVHPITSVFRDARLALCQFDGGVGSDGEGSLNTFVLQLH